MLQCARCDYAQNCTKVHRLLQSQAFGPPNATVIKAYEDKCSELFPLATIFRSSSSSPAHPDSSDSQEKVVAAKNISAAGGGAIVLKETALSSAAMSDLSGDINDGVTA